jgi:peptidoglycan/LPS O-acetylase OafA/YrhL
MGRQFPFLRGLAIFFILVNHSISMSLWMAGQSGLPQPDHILYSVMVVLKQVGLITVPIFLFLSGAFFAFGVQKRPLKGSLRVVWQNILGALWPYLIWTIVFNLMVSFLLKEHLPLAQFLKNILVGYPYNFVPLLLFFYALAPFLVWGMKRFPALTLLAVILYQVFLMVEENPGVFGLTFHELTRYFALPVVRQPLSLWAIYFPLGIFYQLYNRSFSDFVRRYAVVIIICLAAFVVLGDLHELDFIVLPWANYLVPLFFVMLIPLIQRKVSPVFLWLEAIGKRSYGFYLLNLIVINLVLLGLQALFPWLLEQYLLLVPFLFFLALYIPWGFMKLVELNPRRNVYRTMFG